MNNKQLYGFLFVALLLMTACKTTRNLEEGEYLLEKTKLITGNKKLDKEELQSVLKQQPNRTILGVKFHLWVNSWYKKETVDSSAAKKKKKFDQKNIENYENWEKKWARKKEKSDRKNAQRIEKGKDSLSFEKKPFEPKELKPSFPEYITNVVGEPPVILDSVLVERSVEQLGFYLMTRGFFEHSVEDSIRYLGKKKKARVEYFVEAETPYLFRKVEYRVEMEDPVIKHYVSLAENKGTLESGTPFELEKIQLERERITDYLKEVGYKNFSRDYVLFDVDSSFKNREVDIKIRILPPDNVEKKHHRYQINRVFINTDYDRVIQNQIELYDTLHYKGYVFMFQEKLRYKQDILVQSVFISQKDMYTHSKVLDTYRRLAGMGVFSLVRVDFEDIEMGEGHAVDCYINLVPGKNYSYALESRGTMRGSNFGVAGDLNYLNKNSFKGAEQLNLTLYGGLEVQSSFTKSEQEADQENGRLFNTVEFGAELSLSLPKFLLPVDPENFSKTNRPQTHLTTVFNYQNNKDYLRNVGGLLFGYKWNESIEKSHQFDLVDFSVIGIDKSVDFQDRLDSINNPVLNASYEDQVVLGGVYTYVFNNKFTSRRKTTFWYLAKIKSAGNLLQLVYDLSNADQNSNGSYTMFGIPFAQFVLMSNELRTYLKIDARSKLAFRAIVGFAVPLTNSEGIPFSESFYMGGANDLRGWRPRTVGPGTVKDPERVGDKIGDIKIEANLEYRFNLIDFIDGALFTDMGNIWFMPGSSVSDQSKFNTDVFSNVKDFYVDWGFGLRFNFGYFIIRTDMAYPFHDPSFDPAMGESSGKFFWEDGFDNPGEFNLGIGFPF